MIRRQPHADIAVAGIVLAVTLVTTTAGPQPASLDAFGIGAAAIASGALAGRRHWPYAVFVVSALAAEAYLAHYQGHQGATILAAPLIALYSAADAGARRRTLTIGIIAVLALSAVHMVVMPHSWLGAGNLALAALGALAIAAGEASRNRRAYLTEVEARIARADHDRETESARRVTGERLRIARDLHDIVGHQLALINVQAGVASHVLSDQPDQAQEALTHVRQAARTALEELRDTVGLLRQPGDPMTPVEPAPGLHALPALLDSFRRSGLDIELQVRGEPSVASAAAGITAYRVIQEALTNICKHAAGAHVDVDMDYRPDLLTVTVTNPVDPGRATTDSPTNDPATTTQSGAGHGLIGMRERVAAIGGRLKAGPDGHGTFRLCAEIPATTSPVAR